MSGNQIASIVICRPTSSDLIVVASCHHEISATSSFTEVELPSDFEIGRLIKQRSSLFDEGEGKIEVDGYVISYIVRPNFHSSLIYACVFQPGKSYESAQAMLRKIMNVIESDAQLSMLAPDAGEQDLRPHIDASVNQILMSENSAQPTSQQQKMDEMQKQVADVKNVMVQNVNSLMERGERLDSIERRTNELEASAGSFQFTATRVQRKYCLHNAKWTVISILGSIIGITIIVLIILSACGVFKKD